MRHPRSLLKIVVSQPILVVSKLSDTSKTVFGIFEFSQLVVRISFDFVLLSEIVIRAQSGRFVQHDRGPVLGDRRVDVLLVFL